MRSSHRRPALESLPDRVLPSIDLVGPVRLDYSVDLAKPEIDQMRFMEIPTSGALLTYWESGVFSLSAKEIFDILGGPARAEQLGTPAVTRGTVEVDGEAFPTLSLGFGSTVTASFVFAGDGAGSAGDPGSAPYARPSLLGGLLELNAAGGARRFLMDYRGWEKDPPDAPPLFELLNAGHSGDNRTTQPGPSGPPTVAGPDPDSSLLGMTGPPLALFVAGWPGGAQIAGGLSTPLEGDVDASAMAEVAVHVPGNPADVLLTVDTVLPDAGADLVRLQNADLAIVPAYVIGTAPATPVAPPRVDDPPDLNLAAQVVGHDEPPGGLTFASTDRFFEQLALADSGHGEAACNPNLEGVQPGTIDVADAAQAAATSQQSAAPTDAAPAARDWLDGLWQQGEGAVMIPALALEGVIAFVYWRGSRPDRRGDRPKGRQCLPGG